MQPVTPRLMPPPACTDADEAVLVDISNYRPVQSPIVLHNSTCAQGLLGDARYHQFEPTFHPGATRLQFEVTRAHVTATDLNAI